MATKVQLVENVLRLNDEIAALNRAQFRQAGVFVIDLIGAPGCGKTSVLEATLRRLGNCLKFGVLAGDLATSRDGERLARWCDQVVQINTGNGCHLDANQVRQAIGRLRLEDLDVLVIENVGNLICPVSFDLGQAVKVGMFSVTDGDDKAAKHPGLVHAAALLLLSKMDLLAHVKFDLVRFRQDVQSLNPGATLLEISVAPREDWPQGDHLDPWFTWLKTHCQPGCPA